MSSKYSNITSLKSHLFDVYDGFADKRIKNLNKSDRFIVDDRDDGPAYGADKKLFLWFCAIYFHVQDDGSMNVELTGGVPTSEAIREWADKGNADLQEHPYRTRLLMDLQLGEEDRLRKLADMIAAIVRRGRRYSVKAYKYVCPRTAQSLRRLADVLEAYAKGTYQKSN